jgi:hypothetical protein
MLIGTRGRIRTYDLWLRKPTLYPAELHARSNGTTPTVLLPHKPGFAGTPFFLIARRQSRVRLIKRSKLATLSLRPIEQQG